MNGIAAVLSDLKSERLAAAARLDAIDLAIDNLARVYGEPTRAEHPLKRPRSVATPAAVSGNTDARRDQLLSVIKKSEVGVTMADLRRATPQMDGKARSNALQNLKSAGDIRRAGNAWIAA